MVLLIVLVTASAVVPILGLTPNHSYYCHGFTLKYIFSRWSTVRNMYPLVWLNDVTMTSPALLNDCQPFGVLFLLNNCWQFGVLLLLNERWQYGKHVLLKSCWRLGIILLLNNIDRVSSFYWTSGSKLCFLTRFSYFSH